MSSSRSRRRHLQDSDGNTSESQNETRAYRHEEKIGDRLQREHFLKPDSDKIDLNLLLDAVLDINDKLRTQEQQDSSNGKLEDDCESVCTSRSLRKKKEDTFLQRMSTQSERQNFSFRNEQVVDIDRENQRLLQEITRRRPRSAASSATSIDRKIIKTTQEPVRIQTSSEVNRKRFQKKIEEENQALLRRLEAVKPTRSLNKEYLMRDHTAVQQRNRGRPGSARRPASSSGRMSMRSRTLSDCHLSILDHDDVSHKYFSVSSRKGSARNVPPKPAWEPGW